jgi:flagellar assembly protein FliH
MQRDPTQHAPSDVQAMARTSSGGVPQLGAEGDPVLAWAPPLIDRVSEDIDLPEGPPPPTAEELEAMYEAARAEGHAAGYAEGRAIGEVEARAEGEARQREIAAELLSVLEMASRPLEAVDREVEEALVDLAICIARQIIRRELRTNPGEVVAVVREALAQLPMATRERKLYLHPEDIPMVRQALGLAESEHGWRFEADPLLTRGGCLVETETSYIDATVESRIAAVVRNLLGGEREEDRAD